MAVDIVLLPPDNITQLAIDINSQLVANDPQKIPLGPVTCLPHITLVMGCIRSQSLKNVIKDLPALCKITQPLDLAISKGTEQPTDQPDPIYALDIDPTPALQKLHEQSVALLKPYATEKAVALDDTHPVPINATTAGWVNNFIRDGSGDKFWPHITIGSGKPSQDPNWPIKFTASRLGLCHTGRVGTCAKLLWHKDL